MKKILLFLFAVTAVGSMSVQANVKSVYADDAETATTQANCYLSSDGSLVGQVEITLRASDAGATYGSVSGSTATIPDCWVITQVDNPNGAVVSDCYISIPSTYTDNKAIGILTDNKAIGILNCSLSGWGAVIFEGTIQWIARGVLPTNVTFCSAMAPSISYYKKNTVAGTAFAMTQYQVVTGIYNGSIKVPTGYNTTAYRSFFPDATFTEFDPNTHTYPDATIADSKEYGTMGNPSCEEGIYNVTYIRTFAAKNTWYAIFVPFAANAQDWITQGCEVAELMNVTHNSAENCDVLHWKTILSGTLTPGKPYIIRYKGEGDTPPTQYTFDGVEVIPYTDLDCAEVQKYVDNDQTKDCYTLHGTYPSVNSSSLGGVYGISTWYGLHSGSFYQANDDAILPANRFYLTLKGSNGWYKTVPTGTRVMVDDEVVGIIEDFIEPERPIDNNYYDVLGRRIDKPEPGRLYIHQGKKIIYSEQ